MKAAPIKITKLMVFLLAIIFNISCSKDSDLLADYVISDAKASLFVANLAIDDYFVVTKDDEIVLDVLSNDSYENPEKVSIIKVTQPENGTVIINEDNTLTYIPEKIDAPTESAETPKTGTPQDESNSEEKEVTEEKDAPQENVDADDSAEPTQQAETPEESPAPEVSETPEETTAPKEAAPKENQSQAEEETSDSQSFSYETDGDNGDQTTEATVTVKTESDSESEDMSNGTDHYVSPNDPNQVNFSKYGAVGDGITDDTEALQAALDAEVNLVSNPESTFNITKTLKMNQSFKHTIDWNGSTIKTSSTLNPMLFIDKRASNGGTTTMYELNVDGKGKATRGVEIRSRVKFNNVNFTDFKQTNASSPTGVLLKLYNHSSSRGEYLFDGMNISKTVGKSNGTITDSWGSSNGMLIYWKEIPSSPTNVIIQNGSIHSSWSEDAGLLYTLDQTPNEGISDSSSYITVKNMNFYDAERRAVKGFCGNVIYDNCTFTDPSPNNPNIQRGTKSGLVVVGSGGRNISFNNCKFVGKGYDGRIIGATVDDLKVKNSTFKGGARFALTSTVGNVTLSNNTFENGSTIYEYSNPRYEGKVVIESSNKGPAGYIKLDQSKWSDN